MNLAEQGGERASEPPPRKRQFGFHGKRIALALGLAIFTYLLFPASPAVDFPVYEVGSVAADNVIAPFAFRVLKSDADLAKERESMARAAEPVYAFLPQAVDSARAEITRYADALDAAVTTSDPRRLGAAIENA